MVVLAAIASEENCIAEILIWTQQKNIEDDEDEFMEEDINNNYEN